MPERQSSPEEATAGPDGDATQPGRAGGGDGGTSDPAPERADSAGANAAETVVEPAGSGSPSGAVEQPTAATSGGRPDPEQVTQKLATGSTRPQGARDAAPGGPDTVTRPFSAGAAAQPPAADRSSAGTPPPAASPSAGAAAATPQAADTEAVPAAAPKLPTRVPSRPPRTPVNDPRSPSGSALFEPPSRPTPPPADDSPTVRTPVPSTSATRAEPKPKASAAGHPAPAEPAAERASADRTATERTAVTRPAPDRSPADRATVDGDAPTVTVRAGGRAAEPAGGAVATDRETTTLRRPPEPARNGFDAPTERLEARRAAAATVVVPPQATRPPATDRDRTTAAPANERPTVLSPPPTAGPGSDEPAEEPRRPGRRKLLLPVAAMIGVLALLYVGDLLLTSGSVPRGVKVAGVAVGGLALADAEQRLRAEIEPRVSQPIPVTVGDASSEIDPAKAGLSVDWPATLDAAGAQPLNPITRLTSFFSERDVDVVSTVDAAALDAALTELAPIMDKPPAEGSVRFEGTTPIAVNPEPGQHLDVPATAAQLRTDWVLPGPIALPLVVDNPVTTPEDVSRAIAEVAEPAVSAPFSVVGEAGTRATVPPEVIAQALTFRGEPGRLVPEINQEVLVEELSPQLADSETPGQDAAITFTNGNPIVTPSKDGRGVDYQATLADLITVLTGPGDREITAVYAQKPADLTTDELNGLGITSVIGEFTTGGFAVDSGRNIKRAAEVINGMVVQPGETFSLNGATSPRDAAHGYVEAGIIDNGRAGRGIGGGVSQVATTLYNAAYFAGMVDVEHQEHSFYISRYPPGREATVFEGSIDMKFRNDNPTGVLIQTEWTPTSLTVRLYGTKRYEVTSTPGPRTNPTSPNTVTIPAGERCVPSNGAPGFTITDTRTLRDINTGEVRTEDRTVRYNPIPIVICGG